MRWAGPGRAVRWAGPGRAGCTSPGARAPGGRLAVPKSCRAESLGKDEERREAGHDMPPAAVVPAGACAPAASESQFGRGQAAL